MYIPIIIISSAIDIPEASPIIDDDEDMDEGAVNEGVIDGVKGEEGTDDDVIDKEDMNEEDRFKVGVLDKKVKKEVPKYTIKYIITTQMNIHCTCH